MQDTSLNIETEPKESEEKDKKNGKNEEALHFNFPVFGVSPGSTPCSTPEPTPEASEDEEDTEVNKVFIFIFGYQKKKKYFLLSIFDCFL